MSELCLCGSGLSYETCCGKFHDASERPTTAEQLMRSRFVAYARRDVDYLLATWTTETRPKTIDFSKETAVWQSLEIIDTKKGSPQDSKGVVEFKAYFEQDGVLCAMHEISRFVKLGERWFYLDGKVKSAGKVNTTTDLGKNAPCACGSGKKFKRCCGK